ncbi:Na+-driven multidrug efflux pump [Catenulispora sp. MAP12-49]|uniref:MATE family efflux transporter n=1 Tax=Catenulispora sp. MAP12-49 TaxID=3156302 RepID=UPI0035193148
MSVTAGGHRRAIVALAWPVYVELLAGVVAGIIDVAWVAHLGPAPTAAVALATNLENLVLGLVLIAGAGTTVLIAARPAADGRRAAMRGGAVLSAVITVVVVAGGLAFRGPVVGMFFGPGDARRDALGYLAISVPGLAVYFGQLMVDAVFKGLGDTRTPMRLAMGANALILVLDPTLIYGLGFGVRGAAMATVTGRAAMLAVSGVLVRRRIGHDEAAEVHTVAARPASPAQPAVAALSASSAQPAVAARSGGGSIAVLEAPAVTAALPRRAATATARGLAASALEVARAGAPLGTDFLVRMAGATALAGAVAGFGVTAVAAYGIGTKAMYFASMAFYAVRQAATIHSARSAPDSAHRITTAVIGVGAVVGAVAAVGYAGAAPWIMAAFTGRAEVVAVGVVFLRWLALYLLPISVVISLSGALAAGRGGNRLLPVTAGGTVVLVVLAHLLAGPFGLPGVWAAMVASAALQCAALLVLLRGQRR